MKNKILLLTALTFLLAGCGATTNTTPPKESVIPIISNTITYNESGFSPNSLTVKVGTTVTFTNQGTGSMWVASNPHPTHTDLPEFDEKSSAANYSFTFTKAGTWGFHNHKNPGQGGTIIVTD